MVPTYFRTHQVAILRLRIRGTGEAVPVAERGVLAERSREEAVGANAAAKQPEPAPDLPVSRVRLARDTPHPFRPEVLQGLVAAPVDSPRPRRRQGEERVFDPQVIRRPVGGRLVLHLELPAAAEERDVPVPERRGGPFGVRRDVEKEALAEPQDVVFRETEADRTAIPGHAEPDVDAGRPLVVGLDHHLGPAGGCVRRDVHWVEEARASQNELALGQLQRVEPVADLEEQQGANEVLAGEDVQGVDPSIGPRRGGRVAEIVDVVPVDQHRHDGSAGSHLLRPRTRGGEHAQDGNEVKRDPAHGACWLLLVERAANAEPANSPSSTGARFASPWFGSPRRDR